MTDKEKLDAIKAEIHRLVDVRGYDREMANDLFAFMNSLPNEHVSEGLEEAAHQYYESNDKFMEGFKKGANCQKAKDQETIETAIHHAYHNGRLEMREQLMAKAIDGIARPDDDEIWCDLKSFNFKDGDKVKVIVIKKD